MNRKSFDFDWVSILIYILLVTAGWMAIFAVSSSSTLPFFTTNHGKQLIWMSISIVAALVILALDNRFIEALSYYLYGLSIVLLLSVFILGRTVNGANSWLVLGGGISFQPSEIAKVTTAMALAKYMNSLNFTFSNSKNLMLSVGIVALPALITLLQNDTGSALVFGSFLIVFYREGISALIPASILLMIFVCMLTLGLNDQRITISVFLGMSVMTYYFLYNKRDWKKWLVIHAIALAGMIVLSFSTKFIISKLQPHQQNRIMVLFDSSIDKQGVGYNVIQSKIAIGSGGIIGKGFLHGNYTKYQFVPKQVTDFIFCTVGEEWGWVGTSFIILLFFALILRVIFLAENSKTKYSRIYGYSVASIFFFHVMVNIGMTIGLVPVIGIPLPYFSYGGSSLLAFTILLFFLVNFYSYKSTVLGTKS